MKIGLISLGCPKNLVDSEVMLGLAQQAGHELTQDAADADVLVVNTCAFIDSAKQESIDTILEMARHKKDGACRRLIVTGCMAERYRDELRRKSPRSTRCSAPARCRKSSRRSRGARRTSVWSTVFGPSDIMPMTFYRPAQSPSSSPQRCRPTSTTPIRLALLATPKHYAYVKIAEGCDYKCAFCIIPTLRGEYRSRPADSIVREARALAARGVKELLLISQDTTFYGIDRHERGALARLLRELNAIDGLEWIRLLYLYPTTIDDETLAAMAECEKVCNYIDLPLQHASNAVLKRMKRPGTRQTYDRLLTASATGSPASRSAPPSSSAFPGETEADVDELCRFRRATTGSTTSASSPIPTRKAHRPTSSTTTCRRGLKTAPAIPRDGPAEAAGRPGGSGRGSASGSRMLVDGPSRRPRAGAEGPSLTQAPDIDASVFLTDCDPSRYRAGDFVDARIVGARQGSR